MKFWDDYENCPTHSGIYVVLAGWPIHRAAGIDRAGVLYIGKTFCLRDRLFAFADAEHEASGVLWENPLYANRVLRGRNLNHTAIVDRLWKLSARVVGPISREDLGEAERATIHAYLLQFGDLPPLNFALPQRWSRPPNKQWLQWGRKGLGV
jgi:hypothetical protein